MFKSDAELKTTRRSCSLRPPAAEDILSSYSAQAYAYVTKPIDFDDYDRVVIKIRNFCGHTVVLPRRKSDGLAT